MKASKRRFAILRFRKKIRNVLLAYYLTPILLILFLSGGLFYIYSKKSLDEELGNRLVSVALSASYQLHPYQVAALELRDPSSLTYQSLLSRFDRIKKDNQISRIFVFNPRGESLLDTDTSVPIGKPYERNKLHLDEIRQAVSGKPAASVLFQGSDGMYYKSAFVAIAEDQQTFAVVGVDGNATFFQNLHLLGRRIILFGIICVFTVILVSVMISRKIAVPVRLLVAAAEKIGGGEIAEPIQIKAENEIGFLGFVMDEMRKKILTRDRELQMMLQGIAHEVRNPLGGIELFAGMLDEEVKEPQAKQAVKKIQLEVKTLKALVEEFLDFARRANPQMAKVQLSEFFSDVRVSFLKEMEARSIQCEIVLDSVQEGEFDPDQMRRVFLNLIHNSIHAVHNGGKITLGAKASPAGLEMFVSDTGIGILPENLEKLFDPFFTTKEHGTGLGLSFVAKIVNAHDGDVRVESTPGQGTTIFITIPT